MASVFVYAGNQGLSPSRLERVRTHLREISSNEVRVQARYVHVAKLTRALTDREEQIASALLTYGPRSPDLDSSLELRCIVVPRLGTISPWSSKATDIFHLCSLDAVERIERGVRWFVEPWIPEFASAVHDRMTETVLTDEPLDLVFQEPTPRNIQQIELGKNPRLALEKQNLELGLALADDEIEYLIHVYTKLKRDPTDAELMMFAQSNSEHCRHKIFNASWLINGQRSPQSLFQMVRSTTAAINGRGIRSAYQDNAAVIDGLSEGRFCASPTSLSYSHVEEPTDVLMKVETHNHPTAISPYAGAATGSGGEIRDEGAVGSGSKPKAGLVGYTTSHLEIPSVRQPWELRLGIPDRMASALEIMTDGPIGAAAYNNEYGRPALLGYFRTFEMKTSNESGFRWGYHKPIMIAGGVGSVFRSHVQADSIESECALVVLGGPAMLIGLGGGAASSMSSGESSADLDFASVQRDNAELERRCQEVIDRCTASLEKNPIAFIHDVGAGGLSNAFPELIHDIGLGGKFELRDVPNADLGMSPMEIWCNEAQERYVLAIPSMKLAFFEEICERERCPYAVVGRTTNSPHIEVNDQLLKNRPIDLDLDVLFGKPPKMQREFETRPRVAMELRLGQVRIEEAIKRVLQFPSVGSKKFLVTIGDRSITGLIAQEQMVGPYQVPVADCAVTIAGYRTFGGEAMSIGERSPISNISPASAARMAIAESLTNLATVRVNSLDRVVLSANWMAAAGVANEDQALYEAVEAATTLCKDLGLAIPVGKDSLSMRSQWEESGSRHEVVSPVSLIASAFVPVPDVRRLLTPQLSSVESELWLVELGTKQRLGGSALAQVHCQLGNEAPDIDDSRAFKALFNFAQQIHDRDLALSMHDRSDGGLITTLLEMAFAGRIGLSMEVAGLWQEQLFCEEIGFVFETLPSRSLEIAGLAEDFGLRIRQIGRTTAGKDVSIHVDGDLVYQESLFDLEKLWSKTSYLMQRLRDDTHCADSEYDLIGSDSPGLNESLTFTVDDRPRRSTPTTSVLPRVAILRDQGVNGQIEMAAAFDAAGFACDDVHMTDLFEGRVSLNSYQVLAACGGFSYGDVLGAGGGWAKSILFSDHVRDKFLEFFERSDTLSLGVCNGCQMLSRLKSLIPGAGNWPNFERNESDQFEGRTVQVRVESTKSPWLNGMTGSQIPVPVAHGEGRVAFANSNESQLLAQKDQVALRYVDGFGESTMRYPMNPNGSTDAIAGTTSEDGRVLILMPHPERVFRSVQNSWVDRAQSNQDYSPWIRLFLNAWNVLE
ncbi:MAG: phosphoribosylformylglycinamidine synthase [Gammaproteobacteria bacterium]|nr:phosphoribosylformylglycinamidine synthase [Gammaproteobacteria bacterium]